MSIKITLVMSKDILAERGKLKAILKTVNDEVRGIKKCPQVNVIFK